MTACSVLLTAALVAGSASAGSTSSSDVDHDGAADRSDNCMVVANPDQQDRDHDGVGDACDGANSDRTVVALRYDYTQAELDEITAAASAGRMPAYGSHARGYVRWQPDLPIDPLVQIAFLQVWQGKVWYTHANGGYLFNRMGPDVEVHYHAVHWGRSPVDGARTIVVEPGFPVDQFYDTIRMVQPGVYLGISWSRPTYLGQHLGRPQRMLTFILDFNHPEVSATECPLCQLGLDQLGLQVQSPTGPRNPLVPDDPIG